MSSFLLEINTSEVKSPLSKITFSLHLAVNNIKDLTTEDKVNLNEFLKEEHVFDNFKYQIKSIRDLLETILENKKDKTLSETLKSISRKLND